jgi:hypothetical protein
MTTIRNRVTELREELGNNAGKKPKMDRLLVGMIQAYLDVLNIQIED